MNFPQKCLQCLDAQAVKPTCEKTGLCAEHCYRTDHSHCSVLYCGETPCAEKSTKSYKDNVCIKHCKIFKHTHCINYNCSELINICESTNLCRKNCQDTNHNHCSSFNCNEINDICVEEKRCVMHCSYPSEHNHSIFGEFLDIEPKKQTLTKRILMLFGCK